MSEQAAIPKHELQALVELLNRTPLSLPERLWVSSLITRLEAIAEAETETAEKAEVEDNKEKLA